MKIAVLADIHGNSVALRAVLEGVVRLKIERLFILGDMVGYYYRPDEVLAQLEPFDTTFVRGNHEDLLRVVRDNKGEAERLRIQYGSGFDEALKKLPTEKVEWLVNLPRTAEVEIEGARFLLCHGSPWDTDEYIYPDAPREMLQKCAREQADFILMGHTHYPFVYGKEGGAVLNAGSVGQPRDAGNLASWAVVDTQNHSVVCKRTPFDISSVVEDAQTHDPAVAYVQEVLKRTKT